MAGVTGLEPAASGVTGRRSNQLSYTPYRAPQCAAKNGSDLRKERGFNRPDRGAQEERERLALSGYAPLRPAGINH